MLNIKNNFLTNLKNELPEIEINELKVRSSEFITQLILYGYTLGAFGGLWKVIQFFIKKYSNISVRLTYKSSDGSKINVNYNGLTKKEANKILSENPPDIKSPLKIELKNKIKK